MSATRGESCSRLLRGSRREGEKESRRKSKRGSRRSSKSNRSNGKRRRMRRKRGIHTEEKEKGMAPLFPTLHLAQFTEQMPAIRYPKKKISFPFFPPNVESHFFQLVITDENHQRIRRHPIRKITNGKVKKNSIEKKNQKFFDCLLLDLI